MNELEKSQALSMDPNQSRLDLPIGKRVMDDFYVHRSYLEHISNYSDLGDLIQACERLLSDSDLDLWNVIKIHRDRSKISFLQYLDFENDPFPALNGSWTVDWSKNKVTFRSYSNSLNPPILHRKELLVAGNHPNRSNWLALTKVAEDFGLFSTNYPIGFKENWLRLIEQKGLCLEGEKFVPIGNQTSPASSQDESTHSGIQRHLTAISRNVLSAPIQLLLGHGLINENLRLFDYGCGKGDDLNGLSSMGVSCAGWDPHYAPEKPLVPSEIVNLGFVINVIEDPAERVEAIQNAFSLCSTALIASVMLYTNDRPGRPFRDGFLTTKNTFQKYFSQDEFKDFIGQVLEQEPIMVGPGIALVFKDKDAEQKFLLNRYRSTNIARRLLSARISPRDYRSAQNKIERVRRLTQAEREFNELKPQLDSLWRQILDLGRFPETHEIRNLSEFPEGVRLIRLYRLIRTHYDTALFDKAAQTRADEIKLYIASLQFGKRPPYKQLEPSIRTDIRHFFGDYRSATAAAMNLLIDSGKPEAIYEACQVAARDGLGWLDDQHSLQLHVSLVERLPAVLRAYISCGLLIWNSLSDVQLIKIHIGSGKLTLLVYDDFDEHPIPLLIKRVKVNIRKLDYDVFDYQQPQYPPSPLFLKSRYMHEDMPGYAEQVAFDEKLESLGILEKADKHWTREQIDEILEAKRFQILGKEILRSTRTPHIDQRAGVNFTYRDLIECGETQALTKIDNKPINPNTYNALHDLCENILDPVVEYFGAIRLTYGFCSPALASKINARIAPKLDQHASHEENRRGEAICSRLGAAVDFIVDDEDMLDVAKWIVSNLPFDRLYFYGIDRPIHVSYSERPVSQITVMRKSPSGRLTPRTLDSSTFLDLDKSSLRDFN